MWYLQQRLRVGPRMLYGKWGQFDSNKMPSSSLLLQCGRKMTKKKKIRWHRQAPSPSSRNWAFDKHQAEMTTRASCVPTSSALLLGSEAGHGETSFMDFTEHHNNGNRNNTALTVVIRRTPSLPCAQFCTGSFKDIISKAAL